MTALWVLMILLMFGTLLNGLSLSFDRKVGEMVQSQLDDLERRVGVLDERERRRDVEHGRRMGAQGDNDG